MNEIDRLKYFGQKKMENRLQKRQNDIFFYEEMEKKRRAKITAIWLKRNVNQNINKKKREKRRKRNEKQNQEVNETLNAIFRLLK